MISMMQAVACQTGIFGRCVGRSSIQGGLGSETAITLLQFFVKVRIFQNHPQSSGVAKGGKKGRLTPIGFLKKVR